MSKAYGSPNFMDIFVTRPVLAVVVSLLFVLVGIRAAMEIPVIQFPEIENTKLVVTTRYTGADAEVVQGFVTDVIEKAASTVPGIDYTDSNTIAGLSTVNVQLQLNRNGTDALSELSSRIDQIRFQLPAGAEDPSIQVVRSQDTQAVIYLNIYTNVFSRPELTDYLDRHVIPILSTVDGVQRISLEGGRAPAMRVWLDPVKMATFNIATQDIESALSRNNIISTVGHTENSQQRIDLLANTTLKSVTDFERLVVSQTDNSLIYLGDIARIELGGEEGSNHNRFYDPNDVKNSKGSVFLGVWPQSGANEIAMSDGIGEALAQINPTLPDGMFISNAYDSTLYMRDSIKEIFTTLTETILLVGLVVLLLMGSFRTALVPLITIPISLLGAVAAITLMGFSLNLLTILAIVLSVGLVVDDAIVVVENVSRYMREGKSRTQAALASSRQLLSPIVGMTITLAAVYAPIGFLSGLTGLLFREFAFTLSVAVLISGVVALTLSPIMSAYANPEGGKEGRLTRWVNKRFDLLHINYGRLLNKIVEWRFQILFAGLFFSLLIAPFYLFSQQELAPVEDQSGILLVIEAPSNASLDYTEGYMDDVVEQFSKFSDIEYIWQSIFNSAAFSGVTFSNPKEREQTIHELLPQAYAVGNGITGLRVLPILESALPTAGRFDVEFIVQSALPLKEMEAYAEQLLVAGYKSGRFMFLDTDLKIDLPQVRFILDRQRIADLGMDLTSVADQLRIFLSGNYVNRFELNGKSYQVIPMIEGGGRLNPEALLDLQLQTPSGELIPVSSIASIDKTVAPRILGKFQQKNSFRILGGILPGTTKEQGLAAIEAAAEEILPEGFTIDYAGESRQIRQEGNTLAGILFIALVFVYFVLAVQFNSFRDPLVVLLGSVPLALAGAMLFTFLGLTTINIYSQIGFITLVGLVAKNGILIVEFANHLQTEGFSKLAAIKGAAETRLRPVLMTTAATALGHLPLALVTGAGAEARNSIGIVLVAGMLLGTLFTLFVLPCLYLMIAKEHTADEVDPENDAGSESTVSYAG
jgi:multidrug efflux pump